MNFPFKRKQALGISPPIPPKLLAIALCRSNLNGRVILDSGLPEAAVFSPGLTPTKCAKSLKVGYYAHSLGGKSPKYPDFFKPHGCHCLKCFPTGFPSGLESPSSEGSSWVMFHGLSHLFARVPQDWRQVWVPTACAARAPTTSCEVWSWQRTDSEKASCPYKFSPAILGPETAVPIL